MHHLPPDYLPAHIIKGKSGTSRYSKCFFSSTKDEKISVVKNPLVLFDPDHKTSNFGTTNHIFTKVRLSTLLIETCFRSKPHPGFFAVFVVGNCCMNCVDSTGWVSFCTWTWLMISPTQSACIAPAAGAQAKSADWHLFEKDYLSEPASPQRSKTSGIGHVLCQRANGTAPVTDLVGVE